MRLFIATLAPRPTYLLASLLVRGALDRMGISPPRGLMGLIHTTQGLARSPGSSLQALQEHSSQNPRLGPGGGRLQAV